MGTQPYKTHTASNILYLLLSFPLGVFYFVLLITGLSVGIGTIVVWLGIPILFITIAGIWGMAALERSLAAHLLHIDMPTPVQRYAESGKLMEKFGLKVRNSLTWKSLAYLLIKFPLGIVSFCITVTLVTLCAGLILAPMLYAIAAYIPPEPGVHTVAPLWWMDALSLQLTGKFEVIQFVKSVVFSIIGIALWVPVRTSLNGMARLSGAFARVMLTSHESYATPKEEHYYGYQSVNINL